MFHKSWVLWFGLDNINRTFVPTSKPLNMLDRALFVVCLLANTLFLFFSCILTCNCIRCTYLVAVYTLNTPATPCCLALTAENVPFLFDALIWTSKHQLYDFSILEIPKYVRRYLVSCLFASKYIFSSDFRHFNL